MFEYFNQYVLESNGQSGKIGSTVFWWSGQSFHSHGFLLVRGVTCSASCTQLCRMRARLLFHLAIVVYAQEGRGTLTYRDIECTYVPNEEYELADGTPSNW